MKNKTLYLILFFGLGFLETQAQEAILSSGGYASGSGGSSSYSLGQMVYATYTGTNGSMANGVQQPFEISMVTALEEAKGTNLSVLAYPNPTTDLLSLTVDDFEVSNLSYYLYDINGRLLERKKIKGNQTSIVMSNLAQATYFLRVTNGKNAVKTFKIIKK